VRFAVTALLWLFTTVGLAVAVPTAWAQTHVIEHMFAQRSRARR